MIQNESVDGGTSDERLFAATRLIVGRLEGASVDLRRPGPPTLRRFPRAAPSRWLHLLEAGHPGLDDESQAAVGPRLDALLAILPLLRKESFAQWRLDCQGALAVAHAAAQGRSIEAEVDLVSHRVFAAFFVHCFGPELAMEADANAENLRNMHEELAWLLAHCVDPSRQPGVTPAMQDLLGTAMWHQLAVVLPHVFVRHTPSIAQWFYSALQLRLQRLRGGHRPGLWAFDVSTGFDWVRMAQLAHFLPQTLRCWRAHEARQQNGETVDVEAPEPAMPDPDGSPGTQPETKRRQASDALVHAIGDGPSPWWWPSDALQMIHWAEQEASAADPQGGRDFESRAMRELALMLLVQPTSWLLQALGLDVGSLETLVARLDETRGFESTAWQPFERSLLAGLARRPTVGQSQDAEDAGSESDDAARGGLPTIAEDSDEGNAEDHAEDSES